MIVHVILTYFDIYQAMRMFDEKNHMGPYTEREIAVLKKLSNNIQDEHKWKIIGLFRFNIGYLPVLGFVECATFNLLKLSSVWILS